MVPSRFNLFKLGLADIHPIHEDGKSLDLVRLRVEAIEGITASEKGKCCRAYDDAFCRQLSLPASYLS